MDNNEKNIQSRREFFKNSLKKTLPIIAGVTLMTQPLQLIAHDAPTACEGSCSGSCQGDCIGSCKGDCSGSCGKNCGNNCAGTCDTTCTRGCTGTCIEGCKWTQTSAR